jgi:hypothetical protein
MEVSSSSDIPPYRAYTTPVTEDSTFHSQPTPVIANRAVWSSSQWRDSPVFISTSYALYDLRIVF